MLSMICHPDDNPAPLDAMEAVATYDPTGRLHLDYVLHGNIVQVLLPDEGESARVDGLWQTTCFEAFLALPGERTYFEFNFAPSGLWAAYRFGSYREDQSAPPFAPPPAITVRQSGDAALVSVHLDIRKLPELSQPDHLMCGLSAVVEDDRGRKAHWALLHGDGPPDFHNRDCFALELWAPEHP